MNDNNGYNGPERIIFIGNKQKSDERMNQSNSNKEEMCLQQGRRCRHYRRYVYLEEEEQQKQQQQKQQQQQQQQQ